MLLLLCQLFVSVQWANHYIRPTCQAYNYGKHYRMVSWGHSRQLKQTSNDIIFNSAGNIKHPVCVLNELNEWQSVLTWNDLRYELQDCENDDWFQCTSHVQLHFSLFSGTACAPFSAHVYFPLILRQKFSINLYNVAGFLLTSKRIHI